MSTLSILKESLSSDKSRLDNMIIYLVYKKQIKDIVNLNKFILDVVGQKPSRGFIHDVKECDGISKRHTVCLLFLPSALVKSKAYDTFTYEGHRPDIYRLTAGVFKKIEIITKRQNASASSDITVTYGEKKKDDSNEEEKKTKKKRAPIEVPLSIPGYIDHFPTTLRKSTVYSGNNKPLKMDLDAKLDSLNQEMETEYAFLTVNLLANQLTLPSAWKTMPYFEKQIKDILFKRFPAIKYILSGIEIHTSKENTKKKLEDKKVDKKSLPRKKKIIIVKGKGVKGKEEDIPPSPIKKTKAKLKEDKDQEKKEDGDKLDPKTIKIELLAYSPYVHAVDDTTTYLSEVLRVFHVYNGNLEPDVECHDMETVVRRAFDFICSKRVNTIRPTSYTNPDLLKDIAEDIYGYLSDESNNVIRSKSSKLMLYPHIHMAIARTKNPLTGEYDNLNDMYIALRDGTIFRDIFIKHGTTTAGVNPRNQRLKMAASNILSYCLKNSQHDVVHLLLDRPPCTLFNPYDIIPVNNFFLDIISSNQINILDVLPRIKTDTNAKPPKPLRILDKKSQALLDAVDRVTAYMNKNNYKMCYDDAKKPEVWTKIEGSRNSWKPESKPKGFLKGFISKDRNIDLDPYKETILDYMDAKEQNFFPKITLDYQTIEFKDFFLHFNTGTFSDPYEDHPSFYYNPKHTLADYQSETPKVPKRWLKILRNSGYIDKNGVLSDTGRLLLYMFYEILLPKYSKGKSIFLLGIKDSGKTSLYAALLKIYPPLKIGIITKSGGFHSSQYDNKQIVNCDEFNLKDAGISIDTFKKIAEGFQDLAINSKNVDLENKVVTCRMLLAGNDAYSISTDPTRANGRPKTYKCTTPIKRYIEKSIYGQPPPYTPHEEVQEKIFKKYSIDEAFEGRFSFFTFVTIPLKERIADCKNVIIKKETGRILMYLARLYGKTKHYTDRTRFDRAVARNYENRINRTIE